MQRARWDISGCTISSTRASSPTLPSIPPTGGRGIARSLLREAQEYAEAHDLARLTLEVRASNVPAIALYEGMGFTRDGIRPGFYDSPKEDAAIYSYYL